MTNIILKSITVLSIATIPMFMANSISFSNVKAANLACYDTDGNDIFTAGSLTTSTQYDELGNLISIGETVNDKCLTLQTTTNGDSTSSIWVEGQTGTHIEEATCTDNTTGSITLTVHECLGGCNNGACAISSEPAPMTVVATTTRITAAPLITTTKTEGKGTISELFDGGVVINNTKIFVGPTATIKYNDYSTIIVVGQKAQYKGFKNNDGSVTATKIEVKNAR